MSNGNGKNYRFSSNGKNQTSLLKKYKLRLNALRESGHNITSKDTVIFSPDYKTHKSNVVNFTGNFEDAFPIKNAMFQQEKTTNVGSANQKTEKKLLSSEYFSIIPKSKGKK